MGNVFCRTVVENSKSHRCVKNPNASSEELRLSAPAMCLVCGEVVCALSKCCQKQYFSDSRKVGGATAHAIRCGRGIGEVFDLYFLNLSFYSQSSNFEPSIRPVYVDS